MKLSFYKMVAGLTVVGVGTFILTGVNACQVHKAEEHEVNQSAVVEVVHSEPASRRIKVSSHLSEPRPGTPLMLSLAWESEDPSVKIDGEYWYMYCDQCDAADVKVFGINKEDVTSKPAAAVRLRAGARYHLVLVRDKGAKTGIWVDTRGME